MYLHGYDCGLQGSMTAAPADCGLAMTAAPTDCGLQGSGGRRMWYYWTVTTTSGVDTANLTAYLDATNPSTPVGR